MREYKISIKKNEWDKANHEIVENHFYTCWAKVLDLIGNELYNAINIKLENTIVFEVRYCKLLEELRNKNDFVIYFNNHKYSIYQPDFLGYGKRYIRLKCKEIL